MTMQPDSNLIWANLIHVSRNMWGYQPRLLFDGRLWRELARRMAGAGFTMAVLDVGDAIRYRSHPELAVAGAWTPGRWRREITELRRLGLEPIPKLNFSTTHDAWLGPYARCVSTPGYYRVCRDLIRELLDLFDGPRFFHLGLDEERPEYQRNEPLMVVRSKALWEHDVRLLFDEVAASGARPWMWADAYWHWSAEYERMIPRSVVQSNWVYGPLRAPRRGRAPTAGAGAYLRLDAAGYDQILTASSMFWPDNIRYTAAFARRHLGRSPHLLGFLQTSWRPILDSCRDEQLDAIDRTHLAIARWHGRPMPRLDAVRPLTIPDRPGLRVGVYRGSEGAAHLTEALSAEDGLNAFVVPALLPRHLKHCEAVVLSRVWQAHEYLRERRHLQPWVRSGGRMLLMYDAGGWNAMRPPLFPEIARPVGKSPKPLIRAAQKTAGLSVWPAPCRALPHGFCDHLRFQPGRRGVVLAVDDEGLPVVVAGRYGRGRVILCGVFMPGPLSERQRRWLAALARWLGDAKKDPHPGRA